MLTRMMNIIDMRKAEGIRLANHTCMSISIQL